MKLKRKNSPMSVFFFILFSCIAVEIKGQINVPFVFVDTIYIKDPILLRLGPFREVIFSASEIDTSLFKLNKTLIMNPSSRIISDNTLFERGYIFLELNFAKIKTDENMVKYINDEKIVKENWLLFKQLLRNNKANNDDFFEQFYPNKSLYKYKKFIFILANQEFFGISSDPTVPQDKPNIYYKCVIPFE